MRLSEDEKLIKQSTVHEADNLVKKIRREKTFIKSLFGLRYIQDLLLILFPLVLTNTLRNKNCYPSYYYR